MIELALNRRVIEPGKLFGERLGTRRQPRLLFRERLQALFGERGRLVTRSVAGIGAEAVLEMPGAEGAEGLIRDA